MAPYQFSDPWGNIPQSMANLDNALRYQQELQIKKEQMAKEEEERQFQRRMKLQANLRQEADAKRQQGLYEQQLELYKDQHIANQNMERVGQLETMGALSANIHDQRGLDAANRFLEQRYGPEVAAQFPKEWNEETQAEIEDSIAITNGAFKNMEFDTYWMQDENGAKVPMNFRRGTVPEADKLEESGLRIISGPGWSEEGMMRQDDAQAYDMLENQKNRDYQLEIAEGKIDAILAKQKADLEAKQTKHQMEFTDKLSKEFKAEPAYKTFEVIDNQTKALNNLRAQREKYENSGDTQKLGIIDQGYAMMFNKALSPESAVMPSEFERTGMTRSMLEKGIALVRKQQTGEILTPDERDAMEDLVGRLWAAGMSRQNELVSAYADKADYYDIDTDADDQQALNVITNGRFKQIKLMQDKYASDQEIPPEEKVDQATLDEAQLFFEQNPIAQNNPIIGNVNKATPGPTQTGGTPTRIWGTDQNNSQPMSRANFRSQYMNR